MDAKFIEDGKYYFVKFTGMRTYPRITALLEEVKKNAATTGVFKYLFDLRESVEGFSMVDKYELGVQLGGVFGNVYSVAVVVLKEHITGFLENVSANRGATRFLVTHDEQAAREFVSQS